MPKAENISLIINSVCTEMGIEYCSINPHAVTLIEDAKKISKMYLTLKEFAGILKEIEERHGLGLQDKFDALINEVDKLDHSLIKLAREMKDKND